MRKNKYQTFVEIPQGFVYYNALNNSYLVLSKRLHELYQTLPLVELEHTHTKLYDTLRKNEFIVDEVLGEYELAQFNRLLGRFNKNEYDVTLNTTLDCNLNCWYCYESKIKESKVTLSILHLIKKNIENKYAAEPFSILKMNFFGGEPLMEFDTIKELLIFTKSFTEERKIKLVVAFTTNLTLLTHEMIELLKDYQVSFQITLDGYKEKHNKVRFFKNDKASGSYDLIIQNIYKIMNDIPKSHIYIRVNFDNKTLLHIDDILSDIDHLDRGRSTIILRKVWQVNPIEIDKSLIKNTLLTIISKGFFVDYFALPRVKPCFAEKVNQVLFNYDGKIFKCSTIENFDDKHSEGILEDDGNIVWNKMDVVNKILYIPSKECSECSIYPACYGPCSKSKKTTCVLNDLNLTKDEYILYNFRQNVKFYKNA